LRKGTEYPANVRSLLEIIKYLFFNYFNLFSSYEKCY
jgi:hypothetical protein